MSYFYKGPFGTDKSDFDYARENRQFQDKQFAAQREHDYNQRRNSGYVPPSNPSNTMPLGEAFEHIKRECYDDLSDETKTIIKTVGMVAAVVIIVVLVAPIITTIFKWFW